MKYLIVGLGNIGYEYIGTRHNIGFDVLDYWSGLDDFQFEDNKRAMHATLRFKGKHVTVIKPTTYMNLSGKAVSYWMQKEKIPLEQVFIIVDDIALPVGKLRLKSTGSDGGHNGLRSINESLGTNRYTRLRFGVGNDFFPGQQANYVLSKWDEEELPLIKERLELCVEMIKGFVSIGIERTMNSYNNKT